MKKLLKFCLFSLFICTAVENTKFSASKDFPIRLVRTFIPNQTNDKVIKSVVEKNILPAKKSTCDSSDETQFSSDLETFCSEKLKLDKEAVLPDYEERKIDEINRESTNNNNVINNPNRKNVRRSNYLETIIEEGTDNQNIPLCKLKNWQIRRLYSDYVGVRNQLKVDYNDFVDHFILILNKKDTELMRKKSKDGYIKIRYPKDELENMIYSKMRKISHMLRLVFPNNCTRYVICDEIMNGIFEIKYIATSDTDMLLKRKEIFLNEIFFNRLLSFKQEITIEKIKQEVTTFSALLDQSVSLSPNDAVKYC